MNMNPKVRNACKVIGFGVIFLVLLTLASAAIDPVKLFEDKRIQDRNARITQMKAQTPYSIDVMNIGDSLSQSGFSPMELWREKGYTSFNIGQDGILMPEAYYSVIEACEKQNPKYLFMETLPLFRHDKHPDRQILLSAPLYHRFDFLKYHSVWKTYIEGRGVRTYHKGYLINRIISDYKVKPDYMDRDLGDSRIEVPRYNRLWFNRIRNFCNKRGIQIVLYSMPSPHNYNRERINNARKFAEVEGLLYIDMNENRSELGIGTNGYYSDGGDHLNLNGAECVAAYLGEFLENEGKLEDHRPDAAYKDWNEELVEYDRLVEEMKGISFQQVHERRRKERREKRGKPENGRPEVGNPPPKPEE